ncbi:SAM-dependent methyltransferase [Natrinema ejinorense]|nr:methyltransferase domain-containing protein [Natrinema ejinorense]
MGNSKKTNEEIQKFFTDAGDVFDTYMEEKGHSNIHYGYAAENGNAKTDGDGTNELNRKLAETVDISADNRVLFCGCGVGGPAIWAAKNLGTESIGINIVGHQLEQARENAREEGVADRTEFRYDDLTKMQTVEDDSIDVVWAIEAVVYAENKGDFLTEARRVLGDDGRLVIAEGFKAKRYPSTEEEQMLRQLEEGWSVPNIVYIDDFTRDMESKGLQNVEVEDITENIMPFAKSNALGRHYLYLIKLQKKLNLMPEKKANHLLNLANQYHVFRRRILTYNIVSATV